MTTKEILQKFKKITVYGMSAKTDKAANYVPMFMYNRGYSINAVNPALKEIDGIESFPTISDVEGRIEILNVFRRSEFCLDVVKEAVERKKNVGDIDVIWLQLGIVNDDAKELAEANGIIFVQDYCMMKEYNTYF